jgi:hypothetical protein
VPANLLAEDRDPPAVPKVQDVRRRTGPLSSHATRRNSSTRSIERQSAIARCSRRIRSASSSVDTQEALVRQYQGTVEADRGVVANGELPLSYTKITAPDRRTARPAPGRRRQHGAHGRPQMGSSSSPQVQPIAVVLLDSRGPVAAVPQASRAGADAPSVDAYDRDGKVKLASGMLLTIDNQIDLDDRDDQA